jgi:hypothetical protein
MQFNWKVLVAISMGMVVSELAGLLGSTSASATRVHHHHGVLPVLTGLHARPRRGTVPRVSIEMSVLCVILTRAAHHDPTLDVSS